MSSELLSEHEHVRILWDAELRALHMEWLEPTGGPPFRAGLEEGLAAARVRGATKWLADLRWLGVIAKADEAFIHDDWLPRLVDAGIRHYAIVRPESSKAQVSIRELLLGASVQEILEAQAIITQSFETPEDARRWLAER